LLLRNYYSDLELILLNGYLALSFPFDQRQN